MYDVIIVGAGPAGLTAAIYTSRKNLSTLIVSKDLSGHIITTPHIENYPGMEKTSGMELLQNMEQQVKNFGVEIIYEEVLSVKQEGKNFVVATKEKEYETKTVILAFGKTPRNLGIATEEKFKGKGVFYCSTCLPPKESVIANSSIKPIIDVQPEQKVLTADGTYKSVTDIMSRNYEGHLFKITTRFFTESVSLTGNHPVMRCKLKKMCGINYWKDLKFTEPEWIEAKDLNDDDILFYPIPKEIEDKNSIKISDFISVRVDSNGFAHNKVETHTSFKIPNKIPLNKEFMRLAGYYLSEGCLTDRGINFYFGKKEKTYVEDVKCIIKNLFNIEPGIKIENNVSRIHIYSYILRDIFLNLFGKYSYGKKLPHWMTKLPTEKQKEIIKGFWRGDGCKRQKDFVLVTNSRTLTYQFRDILLRLGIIPSVHLRKKNSLNKRPSEIDGRKIKFKHDKYDIKIGGPSLQIMSEILNVEHEKIIIRKGICRHAWIKNDFLLLPIRRIRKINYKGLVYNIAVDGNNTYVAKNFIVHNCDAPLMKNKVTAVVGGGNSALNSSLYLSGIAKKVFLIHRRDEFRGFESMAEKVKQKKNIEIILDSVVEEFRGEKFVQSITIKNVRTNAIKELKVDGVFVEAGYEVKADFIKGLVKLDENNHIVVNEKCETFQPNSNKTMPGIFAAGDVTNGPFKQIVIAAGEGAKAGLQAYNYITESQITTDMS